MRIFSTFCHCLAFVFAAMTGGSSYAVELKKGDVAPEFELPGSDSKTYKLADYQGEQVVVIAWYPKAFTGG